MKIEEIIPALSVERRESYTDQVIELLVKNSSGSGILSAISAAEASARNIVSRSFMSATVEGDSGLLLPSVLSSIGQDLISYGESVLFLTDGRLNPVRSWDILKDNRYQVDYIPWRSASESSRVVRVPRTRILHVISHLVSLKRLTADTTFLRRLENSFSQSASALVGNVIPSPIPAEKMNKIKAQLGELKGATTFIESQAIIQKALTDGNSASEDWKQRSFGPELKEENNTVFESIERSILSASGIPPELAGTPADGTSRREAYRQLTHSVIQPLSRCVIQAMAELGRNVTMDFSALASADSQGRARALKSLVDSGMAIEEALIRTGFAEE